jgi:hypothetical protein
LREAVQEDDWRAVDRSLVSDVEHEVVVAELGQALWTHEPTLAGRLRTHH